MIWRPTALPEITVPTEPTESEPGHAGGTLDRLGQQIDAKDNAGAAESIQQITRLVISLITRVADSAKRTLARVLIVLVVGVAAGAFTAYYFIKAAGWHEAWAVVPAVAVLVPGVVLLVGTRMLMAVASLPANIGGLGGSLASVARDHLHELHRLEDKTLRGLLRWKSYVLVAKLLWKLRKAKGQGDGIMQATLIFGLVANPLFWMVLLGAIIVLLIESAGMLGAVAIHALFF